MSLIINKSNKFLIAGVRHAAVETGPQQQARRSVMVLYEDEASAS